MFENRGALAIPYAQSQEAWLTDQEYEGDNKGGWWPWYYGKGYEEEKREYDFISCVSLDGYIEMAAQDVEDTNCCICPVFWLKID